MDPLALLITFGLILPAELPDKTFVATLVLSTRYRPRTVWFGVGAAFGVQTAIAVAVGQVIALLPRTPVLLVTAGLFAIGSVVMFRSAAGQGSATEILEQEGAFEEELHLHPPRGRRAFWISFGVLFVAEWGDLSQLTTASLSARFDAPFAVFLGAWLALLIVAGLAVLAGGWLSRRLSFRTIRLVSGSLLAVLAVVTLLEAVDVLRL